MKDFSDDLTHSPGPEYDAELDGMRKALLQIVGFVFKEKKERVPIAMGMVEYLITHSSSEFFGSARVASILAHKKRQHEQAQADETPKQE